MSSSSFGNGKARAPARIGLFEALAAPIALLACSSSTAGSKAAGGAPGVSGGAGTVAVGGASGDGAVVSGGGGGVGSLAGGGASVSAGGAAPGSSGGALASGGQSAAGAAASGGASGVAGAAADSGASGGACARGDLKATVESYFTAMAAHDPSTLKVASTVRFTENAKQTQLGQGLWKTAGAVKFHRDVLDTERCGTVSEAVVPNQGTDTIFGLRLKLDGGQIIEVETIVVDPSTGFVPTPNGIVSSAKDDWESVLPADQRSTRAELSAAANAYFDLFSNPSAMVPFGKPCNRLENGLQTTQGDCSSGIPAGNLMMTHRRYPVADLEAGIAVGWVLFGGSLLDFHMFKLKGGKIQFINAVVGPSATSWGWPDEPSTP
jgi:hypothetical protein